MSLVYIETGTAFFTPSWTGTRNEMVPSNACTVGEARADITATYRREGFPLDAIESLPTTFGHELQVYSCGNPEPVRLQVRNS